MFYIYKKRCLRKYIEKHFFFFFFFFVETRSRQKVGLQNVTVSLTNCVGYDKLLFHEIRVSYQICVY
jgi:hypothetical protein